MPGAAGRQRPLAAVLAVAALAFPLALACGGGTEAPSPAQDATPAEQAAEPEGAPPTGSAGPGEPAAPPVPAPQPEALAPAPEPTGPSTSETAEEPATLPLDLEELETRLRATRAIGAFTKLALKGDIDDLLAALRAHHERGEGALAPLRERFDVLVMKVLSLIQDDDPDLAEALARSREGLWKLLADPQEFARING